MWLCLDGDRAVCWALVQSPSSEYRYVSEDGLVECTFAAREDAFCLRRSSPSVASVI